MCPSEPIIVHSRPQQATAQSAVCRRQYLVRASESAVFHCSTPTRRLTDAPRCAWRAIVPLACHWRVLACHWRAQALQPAAGDGAERRDLPGVFKIKNGHVTAIII